MTTHSITGELGATLKGNGVQLAGQFRDKVLHPLILAIHKDQDGRELLAFQACLMLQLMNDIRLIHGQPMVDVVIEQARIGVADMVAKQGH